MFNHSTIPHTNERTVNSAASFSGFYISYNPSVVDYGCATTAIVLSGRVFFLLNGDHRDTLLSLGKSGGLSGCIDYFIENIASANNMSEHFEVAGLRLDYFSLMETALDALGQPLIDRIRHASIDNQTDG